MYTLTPNSLRRLDLKTRTSLYVVFVRFQWAKTFAIIGLMFLRCLSVWQVSNHVKVVWLAKLTDEITIFSGDVKFLVYCLLSTLSYAYCISTDASFSKLKFSFTLVRGAAHNG